MQLRELARDAHVPKSGPPFGAEANIAGPFLTSPFHEIN